MKESVVIIGGGIGGLVCGAVLAKHGYAVTLLDMNKQVGGTLQVYTRDKCIFDSGVHYIGGLSKGQNLYKIFSYLGIMNQLKAAPLSEDAFDKIVFYTDGTSYDFAQGYDRFRTKLLVDFPSEAKAIDRYCKEMRETCEAFPMYYLRKGSYLDNVDKLSISASEFIESITDNAKLRMVLAGNNPLYAGTRNATPWYVHALIVNSYIESSWKMVGGGSQIAKELIRVILDKGGVVKNRSKVVRLEEIDGKISFAETEDGSKYYADHFISSIHPSKTLELTQSRIIKQAFRSRIKSLENSTSFFVVNITLKPNTFKNEKSNYYCYMKDDVWALEDYNEESWPPFFAIFFTSKVADATYADGLSVMTYMRMDEVSKWAETYNTTAKENRRGVDYEQFKKDKTERILSVLENQFPHLRDSILNTYASTPLTFRDYMGTDDGSIYGIKKDCNSPGKSILSPRTKIGNLYLTGQNLNLHGILGVTISALVTCTQLVDGDKLIDDINEHEI